MCTLLCFICTQKKDLLKKMEENLNNDLLGLNECKEKLSNLLVQQTYYVHCMHTSMYMIVCYICIMYECVFYVHLQKDIRRAMEGQEQSEHQGTYIIIMYLQMKVHVQ